MLLLPTLIFLLSFSYLNIPNVYNFSEKHSYLFLLLKCQQLSFLATNYPFSQVALSCAFCFIQLPPQEIPSWHPRATSASSFFLPQTWTSSWSIIPLHPAQQQVPSRAISGPGLQPSLTGTGFLAQNHPLALVPSPGLSILCYGIAFVHGSALDTPHCRAG